MTSDVEVVTIVGLKGWLLSWAGNYPPDYDAVLVPFDGLDFFNLEQVLTILNWKLQANHYSRARREVVRFAGEQSGEIERLTRLAFQANDDIQAMANLASLPWLRGPAVGSSILTAARPNRWTVFDRMASRSLVALGERLSLGESGLSSDLLTLLQVIRTYRDQLRGMDGGLVHKATRETWPFYMESCRELSRVTGHSLRQVDRALWSARGR